MTAPNLDSSSTQNLLSQLTGIPNPDTATLVQIHILQQLSSMSCKLDEISTTNKNFHERLESNEKKIEFLEGKSKEVDQGMLTIVDNQKEQNAELKELKGKIVSLQEETDYMHQWRLDNDLFISGFPSKPDDTLVTTKLAEIFQFPIQEVTYHYNFSLPHPKTSAPMHYVVIGLAKRGIKTNIFAKKISLGPLFYSQIVGEGINPDAEIFINNRYTAKNLAINKELRDLKKANRISKIVYKNCVLHVAPTSGSDIIPIKTFEALEDYKKSINVPNNYKLIAYQATSNAPPCGVPPNTNATKTFAPKLQKFQFQERMDVQPMQQQTQYQQQNHFPQQMLFQPQPAQQPYGF